MGVNTSEAIAYGVAAQRRIEVADDSAAMKNDWIRKSTLLSIKELMKKYRRKFLFVKSEKKWWWWDINWDDMSLQNQLYDYWIHDLIMWLLKNTRIFTSWP